MQYQLDAPPRLVAHMRATLVLGVPLIAGQLSAVGMNTIDVLLAGHLGPAVLGAVAIGSNLWTVALMAAMGFEMALSPFVAQHDGAGSRERVGPLFRQALWLVLFVGVLLQQALWWLGPLLVRAIALDPALLPDIVGFLHAISFACPAIALFFACRSLSEGLSMTRPTIMFSLLGPVALVPIGYALMYGAFGLPGYGAVGSGAATAIVLWLMAAGFLGFILVSPRYRGLGWERGRLGPDWPLMRDLLRVGVPMTVSLLLESGLFTAAALVVGRFGAVAVSGHQVAMNCAIIAFMLPLGLGLATTVRVGNAAGRRDGAGVRRAGLAGAMLALATQAVSCAVLVLAPRSVADLFTDDPAVREAATSLLRLAGIFQLADGLQVVSNCALRGLKDTRVPMVITGFAYWVVGMPVGAGLALGLGFAAEGMWVGLIAGLFAAALLLASRFLWLTRGAK